MKLAYKLAIATLLLSGAVPVQADTNSALQEVSTTRGKVEKNAAPVGPAGAAINTTRSNIKHPNIYDQGSSGGLSSYVTAPPPKSGEGRQPTQLEHTRPVGAVLPTTNEPIPGIDIVVKHNETAPPANSNEGKKGDATSALQDVPTTRGRVLKPTTPPVGPAGAPINTTRSNIRHPSIYDQGSSGGLSSYSTAKPPKGSVLPTANDPIPGIDIVVKKGHPSISVKPAAPANFDRWGSYSASNSAANVASPQEDAERNPAQDMAAAREKYNAQAGAGSIAGPTPLMNGPNAGLVLPPAMQGPLLSPGSPMNPMNPMGH